MSKPWPTLTTDEEAERFVDEADLSEYDFSVGRRVRLVLRGPEDRQEVRIGIADDDLRQATRQAQAADTPLSLYLGGLVHEAMQREVA